MCAGSGTNRTVSRSDGDGRDGEDPIDGLDNDGDNAIDEDPPTTFYQGVVNIFLARFDFRNRHISLLPTLTPPGRGGFPVSLELVSLNPLRYRWPLAHSLMPTVSFVAGLDEDPQDNVDNDSDGQVDEDPIDEQDNDNDRTLVIVIVFQSLVPFDNADTNGLWDIYLVRVALR